MRTLFARIIGAIVAVLIVCTACVVSFGFFCFAIFAALSSLLPPALAALVSGIAVLVVALIVVAAIKAWTHAPKRRESEKSRFAAGRALGTLFARHFHDFTAQNPKASLLMAVVAGFFAGVSR